MTQVRSRPPKPPAKKATKKAVDGNAAPNQLDEADLTSDRCRYRTDEDQPQRHIADEYHVAKRKCDDAEQGTEDGSDERGCIESSLGNDDDKRAGECAA